MPGPYSPARLPAPDRTMAHVPSPTIGFVDALRSALLVVLRRVLLELCAKVQVPLAMALAPGGAAAVRRRRER